MLYNVTFKRIFNLNKIYETTKKHFGVIKLNGEYLFKMLFKELFSYMLHSNASTAINTGASLFMST